MTYFDQIQYVSNSDLKELRKTMNDTEFAALNLNQIFAFGSLLDAHLTDETEIAKYEALVDEDARTKAKLMKQAGQADPVLNTLIEHCQKQHEIYRSSFNVTYQGWEFDLPVRIKMDFRKRGVIIGDLKSTAADSQKQFEAAMQHFDYDQQAAWYMDVEGTCDKFLFVGIGKKAKRGIHPVFKFPVNRGDKTYQSGKAKYSYLAYYYNLLIHNLNITQC